MNSFLLNRALGTISPQALERAQNTRLIYGLQPSTDIALSIEKPGKKPDEHGSPDGESVVRRSVAHAAGVNSITIDKFEGR